MTSAPAGDQLPVPDRSGIWKNRHDPVFPDRTLEEREKDMDGVCEKDMKECGLKKEDAQNRPLWSTKVNLLVTSNPRFSVEN